MLLTSQLKSKAESKATVLSDITTMSIVVSEEAPAAFPMPSADELERVLAESLRLAEDEKRAEEEEMEKVLKLIAEEERCSQEERDKWGLELIAKEEQDSQEEEENLELAHAIALSVQAVSTPPIRA